MNDDESETEAERLVRIARSRELERQRLLFARAVASCRTIAGIEDVRAVAEDWLAGTPTLPYVVSLLDRRAAVILTARVGDLDDSPTLLPDARERAATEATQRAVLAAWLERRRRRR